MLTVVHLHVNCVLTEQKEGTKSSLRIFELTVAIQERAPHYLNDSPMKTSAQQQEKTHISMVHSWECDFPMVQGCAMPTSWQFQTCLWLDWGVGAKSSKKGIWLGDSSSSRLGFCGAGVYHMQVHKCIACKHLSGVSYTAQAYTDLLHSSESAQQTSVCTIWKVAFALLLSSLWCCVICTSFSSSISTRQLCYMVLLFRQLFLLWYLLYRQFHLCLFLSLPQLFPFTACYFIWTSFFCFTLPCLSVLDGTSFTHHSIHVQATLWYLYSGYCWALWSLQPSPNRRKRIAEPDMFWRRTAGMMKRWDSFHAQNDHAGK